MKSFGAGLRPRNGSLGRWKAIALVLALAYAAPIAWLCYERLIAVDHQARTRLIEEHRLWELHPDYHGTPQMWTRVAARLLGHSQLMRRITQRYGALAEQIEIDYRRDLAVARAEVVLVAFAAWAFPVAAVLGLGWLVLRRRASAPAVKVRPASVDDPRYKPPPHGGA